MCACICVHLPSYINIKYVFVFFFIYFYFLQRELVVKHLPERHLLECMELLLSDVRTANEVSI